ncbi:MAG: hypothetical protein Q9166_004311 [cf. Caloplaca sp. 2 TL-2023]
MAIAVAHMVIALSHTLWVVFPGTSSGSWDTLTELVAHTQNSRPAYKALHNAASGMRVPATCRRVAKIRATRYPSSNQADHLDLIFEDEHLKKDIELRPLADSEIDQVPTKTQQEDDQSTKVNEYEAGWRSLNPVHGNSSIGPKRDQDPTATLRPLAERIRPDGVGNLNNHSWWTITQPSTIRYTSTNPSSSSSSQSPQPPFLSPSQPSNPSYLLTHLQTSTLHARLEPLTSETSADPPKNKDIKSAINQVRPGGQGIPPQLLLHPKQRRPHHSRHA